MARVHVCPKNRTETYTASERLNCGTDIYRTNQYMCVPNKEKTSLVEFCYEGVMELENSGSCLEVSEGKLYRYNCSGFLHGCPDARFHYENTYEYPACQDINTHDHCYVLDPFCPTQTFNEQLMSSSTSNVDVVLAVCALIYVTVAIFFIVVVWNRKRRNLRKKYRSITEHKKEFPFDEEDLPNTRTSGEIVIGNKSIKLVGHVFVHDGSPDILEVFWTKNGEKIDTRRSGGRLSTVTVDEPSLTIRDVSYNDAGEYKLVARNALGTASSDIIAIGVPNVNLERFENEESGNQCFTATIKATPSPCFAQWSKKSNEEDEFKPINANAEEFSGTTNNLLYPKLVVKDRTLLENNCFQIEVSNVLGSTFKKISDLPNIRTNKKIDMRNKSIKLDGIVFVHEGTPDILEVYWTKDGEKIDTQGSGGRLSTVTVDEPSLTITDVSYNDAGEYKLVARNAVGTASSDIIVIGVPSVDLEKIENAESRSQCFKATIKATPSPCSAQWSKKGNDEDEFKPIDANAEEFSGTTNDLFNPMLVVKDRNLLENNCFQIEVSNFFGRTVQKISDLPNITISEEIVKRNTSIILGGNVFVCDSSPDILEVFWTKNGEKIDIQGSGGRLSTVTVDEPSLTIRDVSYNDAGEYKLIARNAVGTASSDIIAIGVPNVKLERLENAESRSQCFKATIKATPSPCLAHWSKMGNNENEFKPINANAEEFSGTTNNLPYPKLVVKDRNLLENNCFQIEASNFFGSTIRKISDLPIVTTCEEFVIRNTSIILAGNVFVCDGSPDILEVFWTKNGEKIDTRRSGGRLSTVTVDDPSLTIRDVSYNDAGEYKLFARNAVGTTSSDIISIGVPNVELERLENAERESQCFIATIKATPSPCSAQWSKKGNAEDEFKPINANVEEFTGATNNLLYSKLVVKDTHLLENNCFQIEASNFFGSTIKKISDLPNVTSGEIVTKNKSKILPGNAFVCDGSPEILEVFWTKNGEKIDIQGSGGRLSTVTVDDPSLTIRDVSDNDAGKYKLFARNAVGTASSGIIVLGCTAHYCRGCHGNQ